MGSLGANLVIFGKNLDHKTDPKTSILLNNLDFLGRHTLKFLQGNNCSSFTKTKR